MALALKVIVFLFLVNVVYQEKTVADADGMYVYIPYGVNFEDLFKGNFPFPWMSPGPKPDVKPPSGGGGGGGGGAGHKQPAGPSGGGGGGTEHKQPEGGSGNEGGYPKGPGSEGEFHPEHGEGSRPAGNDGKVDHHHPDADGAETFDTEK